MNLTYVNQGDAATALTASSAATGYPASNVQFPFKTKTWRSTGVTDEWLKWNLGSAQNVTMVALVNTNLTAAATVYFCGHASDLGNATASWHGHATVDETITIPAGGMVIKYFTGASKQWWFLGVAPAGAGTYVEIGLVYFGAQYSPAQNFDVKYKHALSDPSVAVKSIGGQRHTDMRPQFASLSLNFKFMTKAQKNQFLAFFQTVGVFNEVILSLDPANDPNGLSFYGVFTGGLSFTGSMQNATTDYHDLALNFEESL